MALDEPQNEDSIEQINGIQVAIDPEIAKMVKEVTLDKKERGLVLTGIPSNGDC